MLSNYLLQIVCKTFTKPTKQKPTIKWIYITFLLIAYEFLMKQRVLRVFSQTLFPPFRGGEWLRIFAQLVAT